MAYRNKTYIAFDGDNDMAYFNLLKAWNSNSSVDIDFYDAHELNYSHDWAQEESIKHQLKIRLDNTKIFVLLIGNSTYRLTKFVKWEIEQAKKMKLPIIAVNLNKANRKTSLAPSSLDNYPVVFVPFTREAITYALNEWPTYHNKYITDYSKYSDFYWTFFD